MQRKFNMEKSIQYSKGIPYYGHFDIIVFGSGPSGVCAAFDSFALQLVLDKMTRDAGVNVMLYTRVADCICENGQIQKAILSALEGLVAVDADVYIDCTGIADVAAIAVSDNCIPEKIDIVKLQSTLKRNGAILD